MNEALLKVENLSVSFSVHGGRVQAVRDLSFSVAAGETLAIVGESGCGKTVSLMSVMGLLPGSARVDSGTAVFAGQDLLKLSARELNLVRGSDLAMIFQDPMSALNPTMTIGDQIAETLRVHRGLGRLEALRQAVDLLRQSRVPEPSLRAGQYPFEFSGGMLQRAMIAMALACKPKLLIADEPTTALDVTIQNQVLELMQQLQRDQGMGLILITHDLGVVAKMADRVAVFYAGQVVEQGSVEDIFYRSAHPYTLGLKASMPSYGQHMDTGLQAIEGAPPDLFCPPPGCGFAARCPRAMSVCDSQVPFFSVADSGHQSRCWLQHREAPLSRDLYQPFNREFVE